MECQATHPAKKISWADMADEDEKNIMMTKNQPLITPSKTARRVRFSPDIIYNKDTHGSWRRPITPPSQVLPHHKTFPRYVPRPW